MIRDTENLIRSLADSIQPVRPLPRPWIRAAAWLALSAAYIGIVLMMTPRHGLPSKWSDPRFAVEQVSALAVGLCAAVAAFATVVPGHSRKILALLLVPLAGWLGSAGAGCIQSFVRLGPQALSPEHDLSCFPFIVLLGTFPAIVMAAMLRRGAPLTPHLTTALGGLAAAGLANLSLRLFHPEDVTIMLLVWHIGGVFALSALAAVAGRYLMNWHSITSASQSAAQ